MDTSSISLQRVINFIFRALILNDGRSIPRCAALTAPRGSCISVVAELFLGESMRVIVLNAAARSGGTAEAVALGQPTASTHSFAQDSVTPFRRH